MRIEDLEFGYNENRKVLEGVFLKIDGPQLISIIGPNGVGKSTLIHCMNKILNPTGGVVQIEGKDVRDYSVRELAKQMGYVPHATGDSFPMTVMDTVLMGKYPHAGKKVTNADVEEVYGILKLLGIEHLAMRSFDQLSAGQHQKVALARNA